MVYGVYQFSPAFLDFWAGWAAGVVALGCILVFRELVLGVVEESGTAGVSVGDQSS
jgi:hypothetical protein